MNAQTDSIFSAVANFLRQRTIFFKMAGVAILILLLIPPAMIRSVLPERLERRNQAVELAQKCSVVIVVGGAHSNNTRELVQTCSRFCDRVHHIQTASDLQEDWFRSDDVVGITAGTSTPDTVIAAVEETIRALAVNKDEFSQAICS